MKKPSDTSSRQSQRSSISGFFSGSSSNSASAGTLTPAMLELELADYVTRGQSTLVEAFLGKTNIISPDLCEPGTKDPLICIAAAQQDVDTVIVLLRHGAQADVRDSKGKTPMDYAREKNCPKLESFLGSQPSQPLCQRQ
jgi:hypothetical protein